jgi:HEAT repeat protein
MQEAGPGLLAAAGNGEAIRALIAELGNPMGNRRRAIMALGSSKSQQAVGPLVPLLQDPNPDIRAAAAEALGKLGATQAITALKALLNDQVFPVQYQAAAALFALKDMSGLSWLRQLETSPEPGIRLAAAQATQSQPDGSWVALVRELTTVTDPEVRRQAAELLAPHDPKAARDVLKPLLGHPNIAVQELATATYIQTAETDLPILRAYLRASDAEARVRAAIRLLELTH